MTSKQAIKLLTAPYKHIDSKTCREMFNAIEKDLELFYILKQNLKYDIDGNIVLKMGYKNKDYKVVKEMMDNE